MLTGEPAAAVPREAFGDVAGPADFGGLADADAVCGIFPVILAGAWLTDGAVSVWVNKEVLKESEEGDDGLIRDVAWLLLEDLMEMAAASIAAAVRARLYVVGTFFCTSCSHGT